MPTEVSRLVVRCDPSLPPTATSTAKSFVPPIGVVWRRDLVFGQGGGRALRMHLLVPESVDKGPRRPCLVWIHGGAFRTGSRDSGLRYLAPYAASGYVCTSAEYRLSGEAIWPAQIQDCKCAIRYLRANSAELGIDPDRIGAWGSSAGGHLVAMLGTTGAVAALEGDGGWAGLSSRVQAVCDWYGPTDFLRMDAAGSSQVHDAPDSPESELIGAPIQERPDLAAAANPITYVSGDEPPFLIVHGTEDPLVPYNQSDLLCAALEERSAVTFVTVEGAGHGGGSFETPEVMRLTREFIARYLGAP